MFSYFINVIVVTAVIGAVFKVVYLLWNLMRFSELCAINIPFLRYRLIEIQTL